MPESTYKGRAEAPTILPFTPFDDLEKLFGNVELKVVTKADVERVPAGSTVKLAPDHLGHAGLTLDLECEPAQLKDAIEQNGLSASDVLFAVVASEPKGGHLKRTDQLWTGGVEDLVEEFDVQLRGAAREPVLQNTNDGYEVRFVAAFIGEPTGPLRPRRPGTVLASSTYRVIPLSRSSGLQPLELTAEVRKENRLKASAWVLVKRVDDLHTTLRLDEALEIYVDPKVLQLAALQPSNNRALAESLFAVPALMQMVFHLSQDLLADPGFVWDGTGSEALTLVQDTMKQCGETVSASDLVDELRSDPARVASVVSAFDGQKDRMIHALGSDVTEGDGDDVSGA